MPQAHRLGDANDAGGVVTSIPQTTVFVNNVLVSVDGSIGTSHPPCPLPPHCAGQWQTANGSPDVFVENIPVNFKGNADTCGHSRAEGSPDVFINGPD